MTYQKIPLLPVILVSSQLSRHATLLPNGALCDETKVAARDTTVHARVNNETERESRRWPEFVHFT